MSFFDSISQALGTDGGNSGLLPSLSNALGTDGSKNGLLNDPISQAALIAGAAIATGGVSLIGDAGAITASTAATTAAGEGLSLAASDAAFSAALADSGATAAASGFSWGGLASKIADFAIPAAKVLIPAVTSNSQNRMQLQYAQDTLQAKQQAIKAQNAWAATQASALNGDTGSAGGIGGGGVMLLLVGGAVLFLVLKKHK